MSFSYRITRGDLLRYFILHFLFDRWTVWILSGLVAAVYCIIYRAGFRDFWHGLTWFALITGGMVAAMAVLGTLLTGLKLLQLDRDGLALEEKHVEATETELHVRGSGSEAAYAWDQFDWARLRRRFVFLKLKGTDGLLLFPRRDLPGGAAEYLRDRVAAAASTA